MAGLYAVLELAGHLYAVHLGHHDVADDQVRQLFCSHQRAFLPVGGLHNPVVVAQRVGNVLPDVVVVLDNQQQGQLHLCHLVLIFCLCPPVLRRSLFTLVQSVRIGVGYRQCHRELAALSLLALHRYLSVVQVGQRLDECQSYACARCLMAALHLVIAVEDVWQCLCCDAVARVGHADQQLSVVVRRYGDVDATLLCVLHCVGKQVVEHGGYDLRVEIHLGQAVLLVIRDGHLAVAVQLPVVQYDFPDELPDVAPCYGQPPVLCLGFSEL